MSKLIIERYWNSASNLFLVGCSFILFSILAQANSIGEEYSIQAGRLSAPKSWVDWSIKLSELKKEAVAFVEETTPEQLIAKIHNKERDVSLITLFWPQLLEEKVPFSKQYYECSSRHVDLLSKPSTETLLNWRSCVEFGYGRDFPPEIFSELVKWYKGLLVVLTN